MILESIIKSKIKTEFFQVLVDYHIMFPRKKILKVSYSQPIIYFVKNTRQPGFKSKKILKIGFKLKKIK